MGRRFTVAFGALVGALTIGTAAQAAVVDWAVWTSNTTGTLAGGSNAITYTGELAGYSLYPLYTPASSFTGGPVGNAPAASDDSILLTGGSSQVNTVSFATALINPVFAIWSLGQNNVPTIFDFTGSAPFTIVAGGPTVQYAGQPITSGGSIVSGVEGNGVIQFHGSVSSISWTNPNYEYFYGFTVGSVGVPEPATWGMMIMGFGGIGALMRRRRTVAAAA